MVVDNFLARSTRELIPTVECSTLVLVLLQIQLYAFMVEKGGKKGSEEGVDVGCSLTRMFWVGLIGSLRGPYSGSESNMLRINESGMLTLRYKKT